LVWAAGEWNRDCTRVILQSGNEVLKMVKPVPQLEHFLTWSRYRLRAIRQKRLQSIDRVLGTSDNDCVSIDVTSETPQQHVRKPTHRASKQPKAESQDWHQPRCWSICNGVRLRGIIILTVGRLLSRFVPSELGCRILWQSCWRRYLDSRRRDASSRHRDRQYANHGKLREHTWPAPLHESPTT
jgi:hypothetical protein